MSQNILEQIISKIKTDEASLFAKFSPEDFKPNELNKTVYPLEIKKGKLFIISEIKRASPSKGIICEDFNPLQIAKEYQENGASALSVLTEKNYFLGTKKHLSDVSEQIPLPTLRKDFIFHPQQIYESRQLGASLVLLIMSCLSEQSYLSLHDLVEKLGMTALVEIHNQSELNRALQAPVKLIGINNRNLKDFSVDLEQGFRLREKIPHHIKVIAESGISTKKQIEKIIANEFYGALIGESLMRTSHPGLTLKALIE